MTMVCGDNQLKYPRLLAELGITTVELALFCKENGIELVHHWRTEEYTLYPPKTYHRFTLQDEVNEYATTKESTEYTLN